MLDFSGKVSPSGLLEEPLLHFFIFIQIKKRLKKIRESSKSPTDFFCYTQVNPSKNHQTNWHPTIFVQDFGPPKNASKPPRVHWALPLEVPPELMLSAAKHVASTAVVIVLPVPGGPWFFQRILGITKRCQSEHVKINVTPKWILESTTWKNTENSNHVRNVPRVLVHPNGIQEYIPSPCLTQKASH